MAKRPVKSKPRDVEAEFSLLFWAARKEHRQLGKKARANKPAHKAAIGFAKSQGWKWAVPLLEASRLDWMEAPDDALKQLASLKPRIPLRWQGLFHFLRGSALQGKGKYDEAIKALRTAIADPHFDRPGTVWNNLGFALSEKGAHEDAIAAFRHALADPKYDTPAHAWYNLGISLHDKGDYDEAIEAYRTALAAPEFGPLGHVWYNLGVTYDAKGEHDEAIKAYRSALADPKYDEHGGAWNNLGVAYGAKGEHDEAIKAFLNALADPKNVMPGDAWNNLGVTYEAKGEIEEAIKAYRKALKHPPDDTRAKTWTNLAQTYVAAGKPKQAKTAFNQALKSPDPQGADHARARAGLKLLKSKIKPEALSPDDQALVGKPASSTQTQEIEGSIIAAIEKVKATQYEKYIAKLDSKRENTLSILRGWSSAVTLLEGSERRWRGGGYFLKWQGYGIVIDPGFDFLRNFHDAGFHGREIHAVLVSHNHPDHNSDLKVIDDLRYELYTRLTKPPKKECLPYVVLWDEDTAKATTFASSTPEHRLEPVTMTSGIHHPYDLLRGHDAKIPVCVRPFKVHHSSDVPHALGMVVELLDKKGMPALRIGYTADTSYSAKLHPHLKGCDILIAHISQPSIEELQDPSKLKEGGHLGYRGTAKLLSECKPKLALIGEFWAGYTDLRIPLVKGLRLRSGVQAVIPSGLAMHVHLPSMEIECTECSKPTSASDIRIAPPPDNFGALAYLCSKCMIG